MVLPEVFLCAPGETAGPRPRPGSNACGFAAAGIEAWAKFYPRNEICICHNYLISSVFSQGQAVGGF